MFITECRLFFRRKKIFVPCILFSVGILLWSIKTITINGYAMVDCILRTIEISKYSFIFFLVLSYIYVEGNCKSGLAEVIAATDLGRLKAAQVKIMVLQIWNGILTVWFLFINIILAIHGGRGGNNYIRYIVELWVLYFTLPNLLANLFGLCLAGLRNKRIGYAGIILISFIFSGGFVSFLQMMSQKTKIIYRIADFFCIFARGTRRAANYYYLIPIECNNWLRVLIWISIMGIVICCLFGMMGRKKWKMALLVAVCAGMFCIYIRPYGGVYFDDFVTGHDEWTADQYYYIIYQYEGKTEPVEFRVLDYDIKITVDRELSADVIIKPDKTDLAQYVFTLYHGYRVKSVRDKMGNRLSYNQDGDYIWIENEDNHLEEIHICYEGHSLNFYSTSQGIRLPAYFAYYPIAGCRKIFDNETCQYITEKEDSISHFHLILNVTEPIFCSLKQQEDGSYAGDALGITILGSRFARCFSWDGFRIVYSELEYNEVEIKEYCKQVVDLGVSETPLKVIFFDAFTSYEHFYADTEQMIIYDFMLEEEYGKYLDGLKEDN